MQSLSIDYAKVLRDFAQWEGHMNQSAALCWCFILGKVLPSLAPNGHQGDFLEIGTWKGKSASILCGFAAHDKRKVWLVDPLTPDSAIEALSKICAEVSLIKNRSENLCHSDWHHARRRSMDFIHIDGLHRFSQILVDLPFAEDLLSDHGIICLDDFHTNLFPQIPAATYRYLYSGLSDLSMLLIGFNKAYLCRNAAKREYMNLIRHRLQTEIATLGQKFTLIKTDRHDLFDAFALTQDDSLVTKEEDGKKYYGNLDQ